MADVDADYAGGLAAHDAALRERDALRVHCDALLREREAFKAEIARLRRELASLAKENEK